MLEILGQLVVLYLVVGRAFQVGDTRVLLQLLVQRCSSTFKCFHLHLSHVRLHALSLSDEVSVQFTVGSHFFHHFYLVRALRLQRRFKVVSIFYPLQKFLFHLLLFQQFLNIEVRRSFVFCFHLVIQKVGVVFNQFYVVTHILVLLSKKTSKLVKINAEVGHIFKHRSVIYLLTCLLL